MAKKRRLYWPLPTRHVHVLGEIRRVKHGTGTISALYLYETSVRRGAEPKELPKARARAIIGAVNEITCTICGALLDWGEPPTESYIRLMEHYPRTKS